MSYNITYTDIEERNAVTTNTINFQRGFTGHEHWDNLGLIDMNGRFYDPLLARFLSPDPYVQAPDNSQNFNRYSYCLNNPLKYTDPSGEWIHILAGAIIGSITGTFMSNINSINNGDNFWEMQWKGFVAGHVGGAIGAATAATGGAVGVCFTSTSFVSGTATGAASGAVGGALSGSTNAWMNGGTFAEGLKAGFIQGNIGALAGGLIGGVCGGITAYHDNRNVWTGKEIAMGRSAFSFNNTDLQYNCYQTKKGLEPKWWGDRILDDSDSFQYEKYGDLVDKYGNSAGGMSHVENYTYKNTTQKIYQFKGRSIMEIKDDSFWNVTISIDGKVVVPQNNIISIPQGSKMLSITLTPNKGLFCENYLTPFKYTIKGYNHLYTNTNNGVNPKF